MSQTLLQANELPDPKNYFTGVRREWECTVDNVVLFLRRTRSDLQRKTFESNPHHRFVLLLNLETSGVVSVDRNFLSLPPRHSLLIHPYQFHHYHSLPDEKIRWLFITFETTTPEALEEFRFQTINLDADALVRAGKIVSLYQARTNFLRNNLIATELSGLLTVLRSRLTRQLASAKLKKQRHGGIGSLKILNAVNRCLTQPDRASHTITFLARKAALSESRLRFLFRKHFGLSLGSYIRQYETHHALALMQNPSLSLDEVASASGYSSLSTFSRAFKSQTGLSPRKFRHKRLKV